MIANLTAKRHAHDCMLVKSQISLQWPQHDLLLISHCAVGHQLDCTDTLCNWHWTEGRAGNGATSSSASDQMNLPLPAAAPASPPGGSPFAATSSVPSRSSPSDDNAAPHSGDWHSLG